MKLIKTQMFGNILNNYLNIRRCTKSVLYLFTNIKISYKTESNLYLVLQNSNVGLTLGIYNNEKS